MNSTIVKTNDLAAENPSKLLSYENELEENIVHLISKVPVCNINDLGGVAYDLFFTIPDAEGIVVLDGDKPVGLIMRHKYFQKIGAKFGQALYMRRPVSLLMDSSALVVDTSISVGRVGMLAMSRPQDNLYDYVLVIENGKYIGAISIHVFLVELSKKREQQIYKIPRSPKKN